MAPPDTGRESATSVAAKRQGTAMPEEAFAATSRNLNFYRNLEHQTAKETA
jgi:hypothetical protein